MGRRCEIQEWFTRLAKSIHPEDDDVVASAVETGLTKLGIKMKLHGCYLNYYKDGTFYTPNHSHPGTVQMVLSFSEPGGERTLKVGKKDYLMQNGSGIVLGSSSHGVPKEGENKYSYVYDRVIKLKDNLIIE